MIKILNESEREYLSKSILKPYLIHVEFEVENVLSKIMTDKIIRKVFLDIGYSLIEFERSIREFLVSLNKLQSIFRININ